MFKLGSKNIITVFQFYARKSAELSRIALECLKNSKYNGFRAGL